MPIREIKVHEYRVKMDDYGNYAQIINNILSTNLPSADLDKIDVYNMNGNTNESILAGHSKRLVIMGNYPYHHHQSMPILHPTTGELIAEYIENATKSDRSHVVL